jgi:hypothetical protein
MMISMFLVVFRSSQKRKRWFVVKKNPNTTNLDFPSVLLNQGLTEANTNTRGETSFCLFAQTRRKKEEKGEKKREEKRQLTLLRARHDAVCLLVNTFRHKTILARERALHTTRETTRVYKNTITNDEIVTTPEENKHRSLFKRAKQREKEEKHFKIERERSLKSESAIWIWTFQ